MSEAAARFRQPIDLDEFERRLRAGDISSEPSSKGEPQKEDPLAELARLVGRDDPFRTVSQLRPAAVARGPGTAARGHVPHLQQVHPPLDRPDPPLSGPETSAQSAGFGAMQPESHDPSFALLGNQQFGASASDDEPAAVVSRDHDSELTHSSADIPPAAVIAAADAPRRSWRGVIILSTVLATGFAGLAAALTMKGATRPSAASSETASNGPPVILAAGPAKIQPPTSAADTPDDQPSVLDKTASTKPGKAKLVDNVEQPVDLSQQPTASKTAAAPASVSGSKSASPVPATTASVAPMAQNAPSRQVASLDPAATSPIRGAARPAERAAAEDGASRAAPGPTQNGFPSPKRVKVVSVRPDGSIIGSDPDAPAPTPTVAPAPAPAPALALTPGPSPRPAPEAAAPEPPPQVELGVAMPTAADPIAARAAAPAAPVSQQAVNTPPPTGHGKRSNDAVAALIDPAGGGRSASTKVDGGNNRADAVPPPPPKSRHGRKRNVEVAALGNQDRGRDKATDGDGTFAAQLAASPTESAAKSTLRKLQKKYAGTLSGHRLSYHRVKVDGKTVYRVRVTGLSKDDANSVCGKLQSDGGTCFVANN